MRSAEFNYAGCRTVTVRSGSEYEQGTWTGRPEQARQRVSLNATPGRERERRRERLLTITPNEISHDGLPPYTTRKY